MFYSFIILIFTLTLIKTNEIMGNLKENLINETIEDKKKLLFNLVFSALYIIVFISGLYGFEHNSLRLPILIISPIAIFFHVMLVKKYIWLLFVFGFDEEDENYFE